MHVLLVDENDAERSAVQEKLNESGFASKITEASNFASAVEIYRESNIDLILIDDNLSDKSHTEMLSELMRQVKDHITAYVVMSSNDDELIAQQCLKADAQDVIHKEAINKARLDRAMASAHARYHYKKKLQDSFQQIKKSAIKDTTTGLATRFQLEKSLKVNIEHGRRNTQSIALLLFDLDNFSQINDEYGYNTGNQLLKEVAYRVQPCIRTYELFARLDGDEFAVVLTSITGIDAVRRVAERILGAMKLPFKVNGDDKHISLSLGVALFPHNAATSEDLLKYADKAMGRAKKKGKNQLNFYEISMQEEFLLRLAIEKKLRQAFKDKLLQLHYQPYMDLLTGEVIGSEALLRWPDLEEGMQYPQQFIQVAESSGLIVGIGLWVVEEACKQIATWKQEFKKNIRMGINISAAQLYEKNFAEHVQSCIEQHNIDASDIEMEITEEALLTDISTAMEVINELSRLGCRIILDGFGSGFSSIQHLIDFPIDAIKIDKSLMPSEDSSTRATLLLEGVVAMVQSLNLSLIAEGVETEEHLKLCKKLNIRAAQGYFFGRPVSRHSFEQFYFSE